MNQPLSNAEFARIAAMLERSERAMNVEMVDGFFATLICGSELVRPSEYLRMIWGGAPIGGETGWRDEAEMQEFFELLMRHWNSVASVLQLRRTFLPFLLEDDAGIARANDWAKGFLKGPMRRRGADRLVVMKRRNARGAKGAESSPLIWPNRFAGKSPSFQRKTTAFARWYERTMREYPVRTRELGVEFPEPTRQRPSSSQLRS